MDSGKRGEKEIFVVAYGVQAKDSGGLGWFRVVQVSQVVQVGSGWFRVVQVVEGFMWIRDLGGSGGQGFRRIARGKNVGSAQSHVHAKFGLLKVQEGFLMWIGSGS